MLSVLLAVFATLANAGSSVLQRKAALAAGQTSGLALIRNELHRKVWFGGIGLLIAGFLFQAAALSMGSLAVVQLVLAAELPVTLVIASRVLRPARKAARTGTHWHHRGAAVMMAAGLGLALFAASPSTSPPEASGTAWLIAALSTLAVLAMIIGAALRVQGSARAALLGVAAGGLFGLTAAFMSTATSRASNGPGQLFGAWQLYAMVATGAAALYVLQQAYGAGVLAASQPGVTIADPVVAAALGVGLFGERLRLGWWIPAELIGVAAVVVGAIVLSRAPLVTGVLQDTSSGEPEQAPQPAQSS